jgi:hypothetical protein
MKTNESRNGSEYRNRNQRLHAELAAKREAAKRETK